MLRVNLVDIDSQPINILGDIYQQIGMDDPIVDAATNKVTVTYTLFTTAEEMNPSYKTTKTYSGTEYASLGFNKSALLTLSRTKLNLP